MFASRRSFLRGLTAAATALVARPQRVFARIEPPDLPRIPADGPLSQDAWRELRKQFLIPPDEAFFNTGTLGSPPRVVLDTLHAHMTHVARDIAHWDYKPDHEQYFTGYAPETRVREKLARLIGAETDEVALTQNATLGMNFLANGIELGPGDEVLVDEGAHPGGRCGWELRGKRYGAYIRFLRIPAPAESPEQLLALYENATTPQTRVWAIPHLTSSNAVRFPVAEMCRRARELGILSIIDGAQTLGHFAIDVKAMGCDAFYSSPHKWLLAPAGTGLLYIRREAQPRFWTTLASTNWDNHKDGMYRLMQYGTGNLSLLVGLEKAIEFHNQLGSARVEARVLSLAERLRTGLKSIRGVQFVSPQHPALVSATTVWSMDGVTGAQLQDMLWDQAKVRVRSNAGGVRQCCHIYNSEEEVDRSLATTRRIAAARPA